MVGTFNMITGCIFLYLVNYTPIILDCAIAAVVGIVMLLTVKYVNYIWSAYLFYMTGFVFFVSVNLKMGIDSLVILFYFPVIISLIQLLGRRELIKHLVIISLLCLVSITIISIGIFQHWIVPDYSKIPIEKLRIFHVILCFFTTIAFVITVVNESISQERKIREMLAEKEILLAEVFHRVKNNMNIVTSLLNLKKNSSTDPDVINALEECQNRVYSMALVHHKIFENKNIVSLNFRDYLIDLSRELKNSFGKNNEIEIQVSADPVLLNIANAIPCGLIINEFVTNSHKHAHLPQQKLCITIDLKQTVNGFHLHVNDNGPGLPANINTSNNSLGIELIKSLADQINGHYKFYNQNGLHFDLTVN